VIVIKSRRYIARPKIHLRSIETGELWVLAVLKNGVEIEGVVRADLLSLHVGDSIRFWAKRGTSGRELEEIELPREGLREFVALGLLKGENHQVIPGPAIH
jgi:hypothetical protein